MQATPTVSAAAQQGAEVSTSVQEGANDSTPVQEGGMRTRSRSISPPLPIIINSVSALRRSDRRGRNDVIYYPDEPTHINNDVTQYKLLTNANATKGVTIAPSTIQGAGYGLFSTQPFTEGSYPCVFGACYDSHIQHASHNDTVYDDGVHVSIGNRNKDYGCWCNDPLDENLVNCTIRHDGKNQHRLKVRWDISAGEELFIDYGEEFWKEHYWKAPNAVRKRFPNIVPTHPTPAEGEGHSLHPQDESEDLLKFPKNFAQTNTRKWTATVAKKRKAHSECSTRVARIVCSRYAIEKLSSMAQAEANDYDIASNIRKLRELTIPIRKGGKRATVKFQEDIDRMIGLKAQQKQAKVAKSKRGIKRDNPTEKQARLREDWPLFQKAIQEELKQIREDERTHESNEVLRCNLPKGANVIGSMMILSVKRKPDGTIDKYKARLVMLGNRQKESSYETIKSGTVRNSTVKLLISLQAKTQGVSMVLDIKGAYLKSTITDPDREKLIYKLLKYIYGLKQAGYEWQKNITSELVQLGYRQSPTDPLVFSRHQDKKWIIMCIHVDDFYVVSSHAELLNNLYSELTYKYGSVSMKDGDLLSYLGM
jgi:hypothetical protein